MLVKSYTFDIKKWIIQRQYPVYLEFSDHTPEVLIAPEKVGGSKK